MIKTPVDIGDLVAIMRRPDVGGPLRGIVHPHKDLRDSLSLQPQVLRGTLVKLGDLASRLPGEALSAQQKGTYRKSSYPVYGAVLRQFGEALSWREEHLPSLGPAASSAPAAAPARPPADTIPTRAPGPASAPAAAQTGWPTSQRAVTLAVLMDTYSAICRYAGSGISSAMDLRLMLGAFQFFLLKLVLQAVVRRLEDPQTPKAVCTRLTNAFSGLLLYREQLSLDSEQRAQLRRDQKDQMDKQLTEAGKRTTLLDTINAVNLQMPVDQDTLEQAAGYYEEELKKKEAAPAKAKTAGHKAAGGGHKAGGGGTVH